MQGIFLNDSPIGYFVLRAYKSILYLAYVAVSCERRSEGIGSKALTKLIDEKKDYQIVVEFEAPPGSEPDHLSARRRAFYLRCGYHETGVFMAYSGDEFEVVCSEPLQARELRAHERCQAGKNFRFTWHFVFLS